MVLKRTYQWQDSRSVRAKPAMSTELAKLKRKVARLRPEMKDYQVQKSILVFNAGTGDFNNLFGFITQGTGTGNRVGEEIIVYKIIIRGCTLGATAGILTDLLLVKPMNAIQPVIGDFTAGIGGAYNFGKGKEVMSMSSKRHGIPEHQTWTKTFKNGLRVKWDATAAGPIKNALFLCHLNNTASNVIGIDYSIQVMFTDA